jgi:3-hydroxyisobutyrate dehydrogenase-like beta-hydroxyacid dehydrogenase
VRVAFLGLGRMGAPMAARLAQAGHRLSVWNRTPRSEVVPPGATVAMTPADATVGAEIILTMLADGPALVAVLEGSEGVLGAAEPGAILLDMSTVGPRCAQHVAQLCSAVGLGFIDAPVSGSIPAAQAGTLLAMVGADPVAFQTVRPLLAAMTSRQLHLGPVGSGATMKLAVNLMLAVTNQTLAETVALAEAAGIAPQLAYDVIAASAVASPYVGYKREAFLAPEPAPVAFSVSLMRKDVALALELSAGLGVRTPAGRSAAGVLDAAAAAGLGDEDLAAVRRTLGPAD